MFNPPDEELEYIEKMANTYRDDFASYREAYDYFYKAEEESYLESFGGFY